MGADVKFVSALNADKHRLSLIGPRLHPQIASLT